MNQRPRGRLPPGGPFSLDQTLIRFNPRDRITWRDALAGGISLTGASGSGKSSSVLSVIALAALQAGASVIFTTVKPSDAERAVALAARCGRDARVVSLGADRFNPVAHAQRKHEGAGEQVERITDMLLLPLRRQRREGASGDPHWAADGARYIRSLVTLFTLARMPISYKLIYDTLLTLPEDEEEIAEERWQRTCPAFEALRIAAARTDLAPWQRDDLDGAARFLLETYPRTPDRTRQSTVSTVTAPLDPYVRGVIGHTVNRDDDTWFPEEIVERPAVTVLDMPIQSAGPAGASVQRMLLNSMQDAVLTREASTHPVLFVCDEFQEFLDPEKDPAFMRTARDRLGCLLVATQCVGNIQTACAQARDPKAAADAVLGLPGVRITCACSDPETLKHVTSLKTLQPRVSSSTSDQPSGDRQQGRTGRSRSLSLEALPDLREEDVVRLQTGGPSNNYIVEAFSAVSGRAWSNGRFSLKTAWPQVRL